MKEEFYTRSPEETRALARQIAQKTPNGTVFSLDGDLGAGKTVFASGFAQGLGITESVSSPTFTIVQEYPRKDGMFYHLDLLQYLNILDRFDLLQNLLTMRISQLILLIVLLVSLIIVGLMIKCLLLTYIVRLNVVFALN